MHEMGTDDWIGTRDAAAILDVSEATVYRSVKTPEVADREWGTGNWRKKPLLQRPKYQLRRAAVEAKARGENPAG